MSSQQLERHVANIIQLCTTSKQLNLEVPICAHICMLIRYVHMPIFIQTATSLTFICKFRACECMCSSFLMPYCWNAWTLFKINLLLFHYRVVQWITVQWHIWRYCSSWYWPTFEDHRFDSRPFGQNKLDYLVNCDSLSKH